MNMLCSAASAKGLEEVAQAAADLHMERIVRHDVRHRKGTH
jgi:hypothetical protein